MDGWWYDPECGSPEHAVCMYVSPGSASEHFLNSHIEATGHTFVRMVPR